MAHRRGLAFALAVALPVLALSVLAGCRGAAKRETVLPTRTPSRVVAQVLATSTNVPTTEAEATSAAAATRAAAPAAVETITATGPVETVLPADPKAVIVQLARIEPSPWEPQLLAEMRPHFSLQADGYGVFWSVVAGSDSGWYQTIITPTDGLNFLKLLMDDIDVLDLAARHSVTEANYAANLDGSPGGTGVLGVVYVRSAGREGRLVIPEKQMENPPAGPDHDRLLHLHAVVMALEIWKEGLVHDFTPEEKLGVGSALGWWSDVRLPYSPQSGVAFGTQARSRLPADAEVADWPLVAPSLADAFDAQYGDRPSELLLNGDDLNTLLAADRSRRTSFWGPLWRQAQDPATYLIGLRAGVPGSNHCVVSYKYHVPLRGMAPPTATPVP
jgi:hypothetical protein